jgi:hypothetical protein
MSDRPTPEDDQTIIYAVNDNGYQVPCVDLEFARQLKRERDEARRECKFLWGERDEAVGKEIESKSLISIYIDEKNTLKKKCENLFAALEYIANCGLSARHMEDIATAFVKTTKL